MELVFFGSGGGRIVLDKQVLATGGFRINSKELKLHAEPGPGALLKSLQYKQSPQELNAIFVSHAHLDHVNDARLMIECMNFGRFNKRYGTFIGSESVVKGHKEFEKQIDEFFKGMLEECVALKAGEKKQFGKHAVLKATRTAHEDESAIGFVLETEGVKIGYTSDTQVFEGMEKEYDGCDVLLMNVLRPDGDNFPFHLSSNDAISLINKMEKKPKAIFLTHLGMKFVNAGPEKQREKIERKTGVKTFIANEGTKVNILELISEQKKLD